MRQSPCAVRRGDRPKESPNPAGNRHGIEAGPVFHNWGADGRGPSLYINDPAGNTVEIKVLPTQPYDPDDPNG